MEYKESSERDEGIKVNKKLTQEEKQEIVSWQTTEQLLSDFNTNNFSREGWEKHENEYLQGKVSFENWKRWYTENKERVLNQLEGTQYKDFNGEIKEIHKENTNKNIFTNRITQAELFYEDNQFFYNKNRLWGSWNNKECKWAKSDEVEILGNIYNTSGTDIINGKERAEITNSLKHVGRFNIPKDKPDTWIQFNKIIYDITTGESFPATPEYYITNPIPYEMGNSEEIPEIDKLFEAWVGVEHKQELYEILAFAQAPKYFIHRIVCLIGSGANGKSTFLSLMRRYLGDDNVVSSSLEALMKIRFEGSKLYKKLVCLMGETNFGTLTQTDYIKGLSGEDKMRIEFKGKDSFDDVNNAKLIMATNSLPMTADKTDGFYRRWKIINFDNKFTIEKDVLKDIPEEEFNNLARKCFRILQELWENRTFTNDGGFEDRKANYEKHSNPLVLFLSQNFTKDVNAEYLSEDFREEFLSFLDESGFRELSAKAITQQLVLTGLEVKPLKRNGVSQRYILGIKNKKVTEVTEVTGHSVENIHENLNETPVTSVTRVTATAKEENQTLFECKTIEGTSLEEVSNANPNR